MSYYYAPGEWICYGDAVDPHRAEQYTQHQHKLRERSKSPDIRMGVARKSERALDYSFDVLVSNQAISMSLAVFLDFLVLAFTGCQ